MPARKYHFTPRSIASNGMVTLDTNEFPGEFAPHVFIVLKKEETQ